MFMFWIIVVILFLLTVVLVKATEPARPCPDQVIEIPPEEFHSEDAAEAEFTEVVDENPKGDENER